MLLINIPEGTEIRTFPNEVQVLCKAKMEELKKLTPSDFRLIADFSESTEGAQNLEIRLDMVPEQVHTAQLMESRVEFILKRE